MPSLYLNMLSSLNAIHWSFGAVLPVEILLGLISKNECLIFTVISCVRVSLSLFLCKSLLVCLSMNERLGVALRVCVWLLTVKFNLKSKVFLLYTSSWVQHVCLLLIKYLTFVCCLTTSSRLVYRIWFCISRWNSPLWSPSNSFIQFIIEASCVKGF